ncbi:DUF2961 domain-containing protein [Kribbella sp. DT2]|uniref:DUF2961 domain-containing protein n=1 Tax=Kribbella sp. DT2 TaxID=3393427 RepID=UPI003CF4586B
MDSPDQGSGPQPEPFVRREPGRCARPGGDDGVRARPVPQGPAVEVPLGDFLCNGFGQRALVTSVPIVVAPTGGTNCYFPMPPRAHRRPR